MTSLLPLFAMLAVSAHAQEGDASIHVEVHIDGEATPAPPAPPATPEVPEPPCALDCASQRHGLDRHHDQDDVEDDRDHTPFTTLRLDNMAVSHSDAWGLSLRRTGARDGWIGAEGRWTHDGRWMGRFGAGIDIFGKSDFDLKLGLVGGHIGDWQSRDHRSFSIGTEVGIGWHPGRFILDYRTLGGRRPEGRGIRTENHTLIGFRPLERLELYADFVSIDPGGTNEFGMGLGAGWRF